MKSRSEAVPVAKEVRDASEKMHAKKQAEEMPKPFKNSKYSAEWEYTSSAYRITAVRDWVHRDAGKIKKGDKGGLISKESNLAEEGTCWVCENASATGDSKVMSHACLGGHARVFGNAVVRGHSMIFDNASIYGDSHVSGERTTIMGDVVVCEKANVESGWFQDTCYIGGKSHVQGRVVVSGNAYIGGNAYVGGRLTGDGINPVRVCDNAKLYGDCGVKGSSLIEGHSKVYGDAMVLDNAHLKDEAVVCGDAKVYGDAVLTGYRGVHVRVTGGDVQGRKERPHSIIADSKYRSDCEVDFSDAKLETESRDFIFVDKEKTLNARIDAGLV